MNNNSIQAEKVTYHEFADNSDSTDAFEGPEKTLRIYFKSVQLPIEKSLEPSNKGLLDIPRSEWEAMLDLVQCKVLSVLIHPEMHAYVSSESSLFVYSEHIVLKTCGTTTLLEGLPAILETVDRFREFIGLEDATVQSAFYSRRSFFNPEKQPKPHGCWDEEVQRSKRYFPTPRFACHLGANRDERWHSFTHAQPSPAGSTEPRSSDGWMESMMTGIDADLAARFYCSSSLESSDIKTSNLEDSVLSSDSVASMASSASAVGADPDDDDPGHMLGNIMTHTSGIDQSFNTDRQCIDSFAFTPCGYSCNGVLLETGKYFTIHVTPQTGFSYASFETNVLDANSAERKLTHQELANRVLKIFEPRKLTVAICTPDKRKLIEPSILRGGKYICTSEGEFDVGNANLVHYILEKH